MGVLVNASYMALYACSAMPACPSAAFWTGEGRFLFAGRDWRGAGLFGGLVRELDAGYIRRARGIRVHSRRFGRGDILSWDWAQGALVALVALVVTLVPARAVGST